MCTPGRRRWPSSPWPRAPGSPEALTLWAISNHFSSTPDARVGQRTRAGRLRRGHRRRDPGRRPERPDRLRRRPQRLPAPGRPDREVRLRHPVGPAGARSTTAGPAQPVGEPGSPTCRRPPTPTRSRARPRRWTTCSSTRRSTATWCRCGPPTSTPAGRPTSPATAPAGVSDHDPQVARFRSRASLTVADVSVVEGNSGTTPGRLHRHAVPPAVPAVAHLRGHARADRVGPVRLHRPGPVPDAGRRAPRP